ncbi:MAG TPA: acyl-CoA dehydrogenase family protein, partial [Pseudomonadales bacterium]|nr:acyl-CoA dehydrogenase family protein [Pseudomonadales bacterium]
MTAAKDDLDAFRAEVRDWLAQNFPPSLKGKGMTMMNMEEDTPLSADALAWRKALAGKGYGTPTWPTEYGGGGLDHRQARVLAEEIHAAGAFNPIPIMAG